MFHEQSQEGEDCHDREEGQGAAGEQGQGLQACPGVVEMATRLTLIRLDWIGFIRLDLVTLY